MSSPQLAVDALNALREEIANLPDAFNAYLNGETVEINALKSEYASLVLNLQTTMVGLMSFTGIVDPDEPSPTLKDGGTFNTVKQLVDASPAGSHVKGVLVNDTTHLIDSFITINGRFVYLTKASGAGEKPKVKQVSFVSGVLNTLNSFHQLFGGKVLLYNIDIDMNIEKADEALGWNYTSCNFIRYHVASDSSLGLVNCEVTSTEPFGLVSSNGACHADLGLYNVTMDGPMFGVRNSAGGTSRITQSALILSNGALTYDGPSGPHILEN